MNPPSFIFPYTSVWSLKFPDLRNPKNKITLYLTPFLARISKIEKWELPKQGQRGTVLSASDS